MKIKKWLKKNTHSLAGKTVAITGATGGLGEELCLYLAALGAELILLCRSEEKFLQLKTKILKAYPTAKVQYISVDLEEIDGVKLAAERLEQQGIDTLILNAGAYSIPRRKSSTNFDNVFQINFVSQYYLARRLLPTLNSRGGRVVAVSSIAHNYSKTSKSDIDFGKVTAASKVYGNAKRYLTYSLFGLSCSAAASISVVHPGIAFTGITAHYPKVIFAIIKYPMKVIFMRPRTACLSVLKGVFKYTLPYTWIGPRIFNIWGKPSEKPLKTATAEEIEYITKTAEEIYNKL